MSTYMTQVPFRRIGSGGMLPLEILVLWTLRLFVVHSHKWSGISRDVGRLFMEGFLNSELAILAIEACKKKSKPHPFLTAPSNYCSL